MKQTDFRENYRDKIPNSPGVYKYYDENKKILYIGKAKDLKKRVSQYFTGRNLDPKTRELVRRIRDIKFHIVPTENDALLMENNLIKNLKPPFNINLKDNKNYYPSIYIFDEPFPRVVLARKTPEQAIAYKYGPFTSAGAAYSVMNYIRENYKLRTCNLDLSPEPIAKKKYRLCLKYHIKKCKGPCRAFQTEEEYNNNIEEIKKILSGNLNEVRKQLKKDLSRALDNLQFEQAGEIHNKLEGLKKYKSNSVIFSPKLKNLDVISYVKKMDSLFFTYIHVKEGKVVSMRQKEIKKRVLEEDEMVMLHVLLTWRQESGSEATEVIVQEEVDFQLEGIDFTVPKIGEKKKLLELALENSELLSQDMDLPFENQEESDVLSSIQEKLGLKKLPRRIECFDNSNIQGTSPVAAMVSFVDGKEDKSNYRKYNIKTVEGPDDFKSMNEVVGRRYKRLLDEEKELPDLIIIDGGKGQLNAAYDALKNLGIEDQVDIVGMAKKKEEIFLPGKKDSYQFPFDSKETHLLRRIRDEVHRFGITFHRKQRSRKAKSSALDQIEGLGPKSKEKLLKKYKSLKNIENAPENELEELLGKHRTAKLLTFFSKNAK